MAQNAESAAPLATGTKFGLRKMQPRNPFEAFRSASPLELFFDLIFVVAVSLASAALHHAESADHLVEGVTGYLMVFFAIWWAWMNFTWFASAFDTDDWVYRVFTLLQMGGVIVLAIGTGPASREFDFTLIVIGYVIMRIALVAQWVRAALSHPDYKRTALRYAFGIAIVQVCWVGILLVPTEWIALLFIALVVAELAVPVFAESANQTPWNPEHIADRYACFTMIVLGESVLAATTAFASATEHGSYSASLIPIGISSFVIAAGMWWVYFSAEVISRLETVRSALPFGYGHYFVFAAAGAFSAGVNVLLEIELGEAKLPATIAGLTLTVPVALFLLGVWLLILKHRLQGVTRVLVPVLALVVAACAFAPWPAVAVALVIVAIVVLIESSEVLSSQDFAEHTAVDGGVR